jgi:hypothetical protein
VPENVDISAVQISGRNAPIITTISTTNNGERVAVPKASKNQTAVISGRYNDGGDDDD